jgi:polar amino acid transport system substrate-binding protein
MLPRSLNRYVLVFGGLALAATVVFAACGGGGGGEFVCSPPETGTPVEGVPELEDGTLNIGSDIAYAPFEFFQEGTEIADGLDVDLARCLAEEMGVGISFLNTGFDGIIPALQTEDFDIVVSAMTITDERSEVIDFVAYITVGTGIVVPTGNPNNIQTLDDLCGLTVAVQVGTIQVDMLEEQNDSCDDPIDIVVFENNPLAVADLRTGGSDANFSDFPVSAEDAAQSEGDLEVVETQIAPEPYGIGVRKESTELNDAIAGAVQAIRDSGKYDEVLEEWDLEAVALQ